jgi:hypothetical protein
MSRKKTTRRPQDMGYFFSASGEDRESRSIKGKDWASTWETKFTLLRGTGKYEGIKEKGTSSSHTIAPNPAFAMPIRMTAQIAEIQKTTE